MPEIASVTATQLAGLGVEGALIQALRGGGREVIEARVDRSGLRGLHERIRAAVAAAVGHGG